MLILSLAVLSIFGLLASTMIHILTFFHFGNLFLSLGFLLVAGLMIFPRIFIGSGALPPYDRSFRANYNFWRLIPKKWINVLNYVGFYCIAITMLTAILHQQNAFLPMPYSARMTSGMAIGLFFFHSLGYWYHAPLEARKKLISALHPKKKRHRKHD